MNLKSEISPPRLSIVVLLSGSGSNLQAIIEAIDSGALHAEIRAVISNKAEAYGLQRACHHGIDTAIIDHRDYNDRAQFDQALLERIDQYQPRLIVLAGFMRILTADFVDHFSGRIINIHPSLLPAYTGLNTHQRAIDAGDQEHGVSIHYVTNELDGGPIICQARVPILPGDSADTLANRVLKQEHRIYPLTLDWISQGRLRQKLNHVNFDGQILAKPIDCSQAPDSTVSTE